MLRHFLKINSTEVAYVFCSAKDLLGYTEKKLSFIGLATLFVFICKIPNFYWFYFIAYPLRKNEQSKNI